MTEPSSDEKLTDIERERVMVASKKVTKLTLLAAGAALVCTGAAIWFGDWRPFGIAVLLVPVAVVLFVANHMLLDPKNEARWAQAMRTKRRAQKAREDERRRYVEDLERELSGSEG